MVDGLSEILECRVVLFQLVEVEIYTGDVHAGIDHAAERLNVAVRAIGSLVDSANDVGAAVKGVVLLENLFHWGNWV